MCEKMGLLLIPISKDNSNKKPGIKREPQDVNNRVEQINACIEMANTMPHTTSKGELGRYLYQALFSPPTSTLQEAVKNFESFKSFPGLNEDTVNKIPESTATYKGHFNHVIKGHCSTRRDIQSSKEAHKVLETIQPTKFMGNGRVEEMDTFCYAALANLNTGTIYSDLTGKFLVISLKICNTYLCVMHINQMQFWLGLWRVCLWNPMYQQIKKYMTN